MDVAQRIEDIRCMLAPMVEQGLIDEAEEENCERMLVNLAEHASVDPGPGMRHHDFFSHDVLVAVIFNWCSPEAQAYAKRLNVERVML